jgi:hypothetical protein
VQTKMLLSTPRRCRPRHNLVSATASAMASNNKTTEGFLPKLPHGFGQFGFGEGFGDGLTYYLLTTFGRARVCIKQTIGRLKNKFRSDHSRPRKTRPRTAIFSCQMTMQFSSHLMRSSRSNPLKVT